MKKKIIIILVIIILIVRLLIALPNRQQNNNNIDEIYYNTNSESYKLVLSDKYYLVSKTNTKTGKIKSRVVKISKIQDLINKSKKIKCSSDNSYYYLKNNKQVCLKDDNNTKNTITNFFKQ